MNERRAVDPPEGDVTQIDAPHSDAAAAQPEFVQPESVQPESVQPEFVQPESVQSESGWRPSMEPAIAESPVLGSPVSGSPVSGSVAHPPTSHAADNVSGAGGPGSAGELGSAGGAEGSQDHPTTSYPTAGYPTAGYPAAGNATAGYPATGYPTTEDHPGYQAPGQHAQGYQTQSYQSRDYQGQGYQGQGYPAPGSQAPGSQAPGSQAPGSQAPGYQVDPNAPAGYQPPGYQSAGYQPAGYQSAGYQPAGYQPATGTHPTAGAYPTGYSTGSYPVGAPMSGAPMSGAPMSGAPMSGAPVSGPYGPQPYGPQPQSQPKRAGIGRKIAGGALVAALMVGSGVVGAALVDRNDGKASTTRVVNGTVVDNAPIIDRSSLASIAAAVSPSVVSITTGTAEGSGVVLSADGYILTNNHVAVTAQGQKVTITFSDGGTVKASLVGTDPKTDLAVFKAEGLTDKLTVAKFGNSSALRVGDTVLAIGSPLGLNGSVSEGIVSALNRTISESADAQPQDPFGQGSQQQAAPGVTIAGAIQTDAAINPGNSGGALVNMNGEVVGINTAILTSGSGADGNIGVGFAIPSNRAKEVSDDLIKGVKVSHPYLGIAVATADGNGGALVKTVTADSPAATGGIKEGDLITAIDGQAVHTSDDLINAVQAGKVGASVALSVTRGTATSTVNVTLGESK